MNELYEKIKLLAQEFQNTDCSGLTCKNCPVGSKMCEMLMESRYEKEKNHEDN